MFVIHHTNCGMEFFTNEIMRGLLASSLEPANLVDGEWQDTQGGSGSREGEFIEWLTIADQSRSVVADVERIRSHRLVPRDIAIHGYIYDVASGILNEVTEASRAGAASTGR
jgi:carbonic anhydrase